MQTPAPAPAPALPASNRDPGRRSVEVWRWPLLLAALSVFGLLSALLGQGGVWWVLSWLALAAPLGVIAGCLWRGPR